MTMTTLLHLNQTLLDVQETLARERRFSHDTCHSLINSIKLIREGLDGMERDIKTYFEERDRSISCVIGNSSPFTTVIDGNNTAAQAIGKQEGNTPEQP